MIGCIYLKDIRSSLLPPKLKNNNYASHQHLTSSKNISTKQSSFQFPLSLHSPRSMFLSIGFREELFRSWRTYLLSWWKEEMMTKMYELTYSMIHTVNHWQKDQYTGWHREKNHEVQTAHIITVKIWVIIKCSTCQRTANISVISLAKVSHLRW